MSEHVKYIRERMGGQHGRDYIERCSAEDLAHGINSMGSLAQDNAYGEVMSLDSDGKKCPVICQHGGSMWLCRSCAEGILKNQDSEDEASRQVDLTCAQCVATTEALTKERKQREELEEENYRLSMSPDNVTDTLMELQTRKLETKLKSEIKQREELEKERALGIAKWSAITEELNIILNKERQQKDILEGAIKHLSLLGTYKDEALVTPIRMDHYQYGRQLAAEALEKAKEIRNES